MSFKDSHEFYVDGKGKTRFRGNKQTWANVVRTDLSLDYFCYTNPPEDMRIKTRQSTTVHSHINERKLDETWISGYVSDLSNSQFFKKKEKRSLQISRKPQNKKKTHRTEYLKNVKPKNMSLSQRNHYQYDPGSLYDENGLRKSRHEYWTDINSVLFEYLLRDIEFHFEHTCSFFCECMGSTCEHLLSCHCNYITPAYINWLRNRYYILKTERPDIVNYGSDYPLTLQLIS